MTPSDKMTPSDPDWSTQIISLLAVVLKSNVKKRKKKAKKGKTAQKPAKKTSKTAES
jgi:hypothetical protein